MILEDSLSIKTKKNKYLEDFKAYYMVYLKDGIKGFYMTNTPQSKTLDGRDYSLRIKPDGLTLILGKKNVVWHYSFDSGETLCNGVSSAFGSFYALLRKIHVDQKNKKVECFIEK
jgi:hypothetical protein